MANELSIILTGSRCLTASCRGMIEKTTEGVDGLKKISLGCPVCLKSYDRLPEQAISPASFLRLAKLFHHPPIDIGSV